MAGGKEWIGPRFERNKFSKKDISFPLQLKHNRVIFVCSGGGGPMPQ